MFSSEWQAVLRVREALIAVLGELSQWFLIPVNVARAYCEGETYSDGFVNGSCCHRTVSHFYSVEL